MTPRGAAVGWSGQRVEERSAEEEEKDEGDGGRRRRLYGSWMALRPSLEGRADEVMTDVRVQRIAWSA